MEKRWLLKSVPDLQLIENLTDSLKTDASIAEMLLKRGVDNFEDAKTFFRPLLSQLHDPYLMKDMDKAIERLSSAINNKEKVLIFGDYDVDGTTAVALTYRFFKSIFSDTDYYIPDRYEEGYGVSYQSIDYASENGFTLIIALDCGIKANDKVAYAKEKGIDYIICDHHRPGVEIPDAIVLDPKRNDCSYPYKELSGCGIGFKLVQAYQQKYNTPEKEIFELLDFCAISIAADIVPITGENRVLTYFGLEQINKNPRPGIKALLKSKKNKKTVTDLVFVAAPQINAAGRIESGKQAVHLLISEEEAQAEKACQLIAAHNNQRKEFDQQITQEALEQIQSKEEWLAANSTVVFQKDWHKGVVGIVASRLMETYYRPTIVLTESNGKASGSARSVRNFDIYDALEACSDCLEQFGGHKYAAGMTLPLENVESFREKFEDVVQKTLDPDLLTPEIHIERELRFNEIFQPGDKAIPKFYRILKQFAPFGPENMRPVFVSTEVKSKDARIVGEKHVKAILYQEGNPEIAIDAIGFNLGAFIEKIQTQNFHIAYTLEENHWNNKTSLQINIKDIKFGALELNH